MRILLIAPGISIHSRRFLEMMLEAGHEVSFLDTADPKPQASKGYRFVPYPGMFGLDRLGIRRINAWGDWIKRGRLLSLWRSLKPDIVHVHWADVRAYHCALAGVHPLVISCWGSDINNLFSSEGVAPDYRRKISAALAAADVVTADSREVLARAEILAGKELRQALFYFGIDFEKFKPGYEREAQALRARLGLPPGARVLLSPRALRPLMGQHHILEAFSKISNEWPSSVLVLKRYLRLDDGYEGRLRSQIDTLGLSRRVYWLDEARNDQMPVEYALADVIVNYPERDAFPVTFFEAAACRRPVVSSDLPAYEGGVGRDVFWMARPQDPDALADALRKCLALPEKEAAQRLDRGLAAARERADRRKCFSEMEAIYRSLPRA